MKPQIIQWLADRSSRIEGLKQDLTKARFNSEYSPRKRELQYLIQSCIETNIFDTSTKEDMEIAEKNIIDLAYLIGVFNVSGIDGLAKETERLKLLKIKPHEIFNNIK